MTDQHVSDEQFFHACAMRRLRKEHPHSPLAALERLAEPLALRLQAEASCDDPSEVAEVHSFLAAGRAGAS